MGVPYFLHNSGQIEDNAVAAAFISIYKLRDLARADVFDYVESFNNRTRRHSHLGGVSLEAFEMASLRGSEVSSLLGSARTWWQVKVAR